jgi:hypothetical protein
LERQIVSKLSPDFGVDAHLDQLPTQPSAINQRPHSNKHKRKMPQSRKRRLDEGRNEIKMCEDYSMRYEKTLNSGQERWRCSRHTLGEDADGEMRHCRGSARRFPWKAELKPHTYHSEWCKPVPNDEEVSHPPTSPPLHAPPLPFFRCATSRTSFIAAADDTVQASQVVAARQAHLEMISSILSHYKHKEREEPRDAELLNVEEVEGMELYAPGEADWEADEEEDVEA